MHLDTWPTLVALNAIVLKVFAHRTQHTYSILAKEVISSHSQCHLLGQGYVPLSRHFGGLLKCIVYCVVSLGLCMCIGTNLMACE